jgi:cyanophycinase
VIVPSAYPFSSPSAARRRYSGWQQVGAARVDYLDTDSRDEADSSEFARPLASATGVWLCGGYQGRLESIYGGTRTERAIRQVVERGGVVGGTSAGAAIMSQVMIRYGRSQARLGNGFSLLTGAVVDQHFSQRSRQARLLGVLKERPELVGLGVDEGTAAVVHRDRVTVVGHRKATLYLPQGTAGAPLVHELVAGRSLRLAERAAHMGRFVEPIALHK